MIWKILGWALNAGLTFVLLGLYTGLMHMAASADYMAEHAGAPKHGIDPWRVFITLFFIVLIWRLWV